MITTIFKMVRYKNWSYPNDLPLNYLEIPGHFDCSSISCNNKYSLHTEYSYGLRKMNSILLKGLDNIKNAKDKMGIPLLWYSDKWAKEFAKFIVRLVGVNKAPSVIEIHPPFKDYSDLKSFIKNYSIFEKEILKVFPKVQIVIENRCGSRHSKGFILQKSEDIIELCKLITKNKLKLGIALDFPQLFTAHHIDKFDDSRYLELVKSFTRIRNQIYSVHLWGKKISPKTGLRIAHAGDLNTFFDNNTKVKDKFIDEFALLFNDKKPRYLVLEVNNSNESLNSIVRDLMKNVNFV